MTVERGFYRHHKGPIYFVHGIAENHGGGPDIVIYESRQGVNKTPQRMCYRTVEDFTNLVPCESIAGAAFRISEPRFVRVHDWKPEP